jgi:5-methylcytosine-specific restriction enzyme B
MEKTMEDLRSDEGLRAAIKAASEEAAKNPDYGQWVARVADLIDRVKGADKVTRSSLAFQQVLWEDNPISGVGMGTVNIQAALEDAAFRDWVAEASLQPVPSSLADRLEFYQDFFAELQRRIRTFSTRTPWVKMFRVMAALFPADFTTIADRAQAQDLYAAILPGKGRDPLKRQLEITTRFSNVLGPPEQTARGLAERMVLPWEVLSFVVNQQSPSAAEPVRESTVEVPKLKPLPAVQRRKGMTSIRGGLDSVLNATRFVGDGVAKDELLDHLRAEFPGYAKSSLGTLFNVLKNEFYVIRSEGDQVVLTEQGESLLETGDVGDLLPGLITRILGVDNVLVALRDEGAKSQKQIYELLQNVNPGWTTSFAPGALVKWLKDFGLLKVGQDGQVALTDDGRQLADLIHWQPEVLPREEPADLIPPDIAAEAAKVSVPSFDQIKARLPANVVFADEELLSLHIALWAHERRHFSVLAGLSGSGKTLMARAYAEAITSEYAERGDAHRFTLVVQPGWYDPSPLFGYVNPLDGDRYVRPPLVDFLLHAAQHPADAHMLILDEMNLSHPEQYLAPVLSAMETGDELRFHNEGQEFDGVPAHIPYPRNLCILGTVNMDETTHGLSDKVLDRAFTLEFWRVDLDSYPRWQRPSLTATDIENVRKVLDGLMQALEPVRLHFAWRTLDDVLGYLDFYRQQVPGEPITTALDKVVYAKILPKLRGSDNPRLDQALADAIAILAGAGLARSKAKVEELQVDLREHGSMRFWR